MSLKHAALGLLATAGPASGYDLLRIFRRSLANVWPATQSQLYTELGKLADAGMVTVAAEGARGRKEYELTESGMAELQHWITEVEPTALRRSDALLRTFFLGLVSREQAEEYLHRRAEVATQQHEQLRLIAKELDSDSGPLTSYGRLALEWGLRFTEMQRDWADWAGDELRAIPPRTEHPV